MSCMTAFSNHDEIGDPQTRRPVRDEPWRTASFDDPERGAAFKESPHGGARRASEERGAEGDQPVLLAQALSKTYRLGKVQVRALGGVSVAIARGIIVCITG